MYKIIIIIFHCCLILHSSTYSLLTNVKVGLKYVIQKREWNNKYHTFPTDSQLYEMAKIIDSNKDVVLDSISLIALMVAESRMNIKAASSKSALSIFQLTPSTKIYLLNKYGTRTTNLVKINKKIITNVIIEKDINSPIQDTKLVLKLLSEINITLFNRYKVKPKIEEIIWAYNAGCGTLINNNWHFDNYLVWIQPKLLAQSVIYYKENFNFGIYDIDYDYPCYRFKTETFDEKVSLRFGRRFKIINVNISKLTLSIEKNSYKIGAGEIINGVCRTPTGRFRIIWKCKYSKGVKEGGVFGVAFLRLNHKDKENRSLLIHGTNDDKVIGTYHTWGCIRVYNDVMLKLYDELEIGDWIIIEK